jgi:Spy/CpxP family protein refolding chaperone
VKIQKKPLVVLLAGSLLLGSAAALAFGGGYDGHHGGCQYGESRHGGYGHGDRMYGLKQLDLSDEQRNAFRDLFKSQRDGKREQRDAMRDNREAIRDAIDKGASDSELRALADKQGKFVADRIMERAAFRAKVAEILTDEQEKQLQAFREERMERFERW